MVRQKIVHCGKGTRTYYREVDIIEGEEEKEESAKAGTSELQKFSEASSSALQGKFYWI